ncbi:MAG: type II secretion system F family protein [Christensenellales bacterium]|jgi:type IV pilus assembly protein PilC
MGKERHDMSGGELAAFCEQLLFIVKGGVPLQEGLMILQEDAQPGGDAQLLSQLLEPMEMGSSLADAMARTGRFPSYMIQMVRIGEASGKLEAVLEGLCAYYQRNEAVSQSIRSAITYPLVMIAMMLGVIGVIVVQILPVFQQVFHQLGGEMSGLALGIMGVGEAFSRYAVVILAVIAGLALALILLRRTQRGRRWLSALGGRLFRKLTDTVAASRFATAMSLMLQSGMDVDQSLEMTAELMDQPRGQQLTARLIAAVDAGESLAKAVVDTGLFPGLYGRMIAIGFKTGTLDTVMERIAQAYEELVDRRISGLIAALEPTLVAVLCLVIGLILLSVMLPLMGIMSAIG